MRFNVEYFENQVNTKSSIIHVIHHVKLIKGTILNRTVGYHPCQSYSDKTKT